MTARTLLTHDTSTSTLYQCMHRRACLTEMTLASPLPRSTQLWLAVAGLLAGLYALRAFVSEIPPEDHVALSIILCMLLTQAALSLEQSILKISLPENRCWVFHRRLWICRGRSLPVSQIHSAHLEFEPEQNTLGTAQARIVLITSLGMVPVNEKYQGGLYFLDSACRQINEFLASQNRYLNA